jgi:Fe-Mn family superoxide dismutase
MFHVTRELADLPYDMKALDPILSEETFNYHYRKHHATYVKNLKNLVQGTSFEDCSVETIIRTTNENNNFPLFNNAAQHWSHSFFGIVCH